MGCSGRIRNSRRMANPWPATRLRSKTSFALNQPIMQKQTNLFVACIVSLVAVSIGFVVRAFLITEWGVRFNLSETQIGSIQGAGLYPQALRMIFFSLIIDRVGYGRIMAFAFTGHVVSALITITAGGYAGLYLGTWVFAL